MPRPTKLEAYERKRDFQKTAEPKGDDVIKPSKALRFVVQRHDATRLHYDLRLELDGVLQVLGRDQGSLPQSRRTSGWPSKSRIIRWATAISKGRSRRANMAAGRSNYSIEGPGRRRARLRQRPRWRPAS